MESVLNDLNGKIVCQTGSVSDSFTKTEFFFLLPIVIKNIAPLPKLLIPSQWPRSGRVFARMLEMEGGAVE